jgi:AcrR family transcriptional regulator
MPARIDPQRRRQLVVDAAFRLVVAEGMQGVSLRKVAAEAGLNIGSVRHYFEGHEDLLAAAARESGERMGRRLARHPAEGLAGLSGEPAVEALRELVEQVLPVDGQRRAEAVVVTELILASRTRPVFAPVAARMAADLHEVLREALAALGHPGPDAGARQISALVGGLTLDAITPHGALGPAQVRQTLEEAIRQLLGVPRRG